MDAPEIIFEDNHLIVINKKAGDIAQGDKTGDSPVSEAVKDFIKKRDGKQGNVFIGLPHRLDRPTTGILILAKTGKALSRLTKLFAEGQVEKRYLAIVPLKSIAGEGTLVHFLAKDEKFNRSRAYIKEPAFVKTKKAVLHFKLLAKGENYQLLDITLETGRHHQIRAQLSSVGLPVKGDLKYGAPRPNEDKSISLHSYKAIFLHPVTKERLEVTAPVPKDRLWQELGRGMF